MSQRRARSQTYPPTGRACADAGRELGILARSCVCTTQEEFNRAVTEPPHRLLAMVQMVAHMRARVRGFGQAGDTILASLQRQPRTQRAELLLRESWALYRVVRQRACPRSAQPAVEADDVPLPWTRSVSRYLRPTGVRPPAETHRAVVRAAQARVRLQELWTDLARHSAVVWVDNYARQRYRRTPQDPNVSLNVTVMAVMRAPLAPIPAFPGFPALDRVDGRLEPLAEELAGYGRRRLIPLLALVVTEPLTPADFRVPLDLPRRDARSPVWRPFSLSDYRVGSQTGLLQVLHFLRQTVAEHVRPHPLPVLADENVWYRTAKLVYGREAQAWDVAGALGRLPPLYGVWHPYKLVVNTVYRRFLPLLLYFQDGTLPTDGRPVSTVSDLQTLERWLGGLLLVSREATTRAGALCDELRRRLPELEAAWDAADAEAPVRRGRVGTACGWPPGTGWRRRGATSGRGRRRCRRPSGCCRRGSACRRRRRRRGRRRRRCAGPGRTWP